MHGAFFKNSISVLEEMTGGKSMEQKVYLKAITEDNVLDVCKLSETLSEQHRRMVAPNAVSLAQALVTDGAWYRAIYADDELIGFVMTHMEIENGETEAFLWRLMIASAFQGKGYGRRALQILIDDLRGQGHRELVTSCGQGEGSPQGFYERLGFKPNGEMLDDEVVMVLAL